jgi:uncharacterized protein involved in outer membrane biogenesis
MRVAIKLVIGFIALMACTLGISVAFLATAGDDFIRRLLHHQMAEIIDREVRVDGTVSLDVSLEPTLRITDVRIANAPWAPDRSFAHLERAEVQIVLSPLFSGIVHLRRLVFEGLTLQLETAADGRENWHLLAARAEDEEEPEERGDAFYPSSSSFRSMTSPSSTRTGKRGGPRNWSSSDCASLATAMTADSRSREAAA